MKAKYPIRPAFKGKKAVLMISATLRRDVVCSFVRVEERTCCQLRIRAQSLSVTGRIQIKRFSKSNKTAVQSHAIS